MLACDLMSSTSSFPREMETATAVSTDLNDSITSDDGHAQQQQQPPAKPLDSVSATVSLEESSSGIQPAAFANSMARSSSQFLVQTNGGEGVDMTESLQNLSKAIVQRQRSETQEQQQQLGQDNHSMASSNGSLPSLVDRIVDVQSLVEKVVAKQRR